MYQLPDFEPNFVYADVNAGLDYERAVARLKARAGEAFRKYWFSKQRKGSDATEIARLHDVYLDAMREQRKLAPGDTAKIKAILSQV